MQRSSSRRSRILRDDDRVAATLQDLVEEYRTTGSCDTATAMQNLKKKLDIAVGDIVIE